MQTKWLPVEAAKQYCEHSISELEVIYRYTQERPYF